MSWKDKDGRARQMKKDNEVKEEIAVYSWDSYPTCLSFLSKGEGKVYIRKYKEYS